MGATLCTCVKTLCYARKIEFLSTWQVLSDVAAFMLPMT